jgi:hypothetical protein
MRQSGLGEQVWDLDPDLGDKMAKALPSYPELSEMFLSLHRGRKFSCSLRRGTGWGIMIHFHVRSRLWYL